MVIVTVITAVAVVVALSAVRMSSICSREEEKGSTSHNENADKNLGGK